MPVYDLKLAKPTKSAAFLELVTKDLGEDGDADLVAAGEGYLAINVGETEKDALLARYAATGAEIAVIERVSYDPKELAPRLTEAHLEQLFSQAPRARRRKSVVVELSGGSGGDALDLILCLDEVAPTYAATVRKRAGELADLDGRFGYEYEADQFLEGLRLDPAVMGARVAETLATFEAFARARGIPHVRLLPPWPGDPRLFHVWLGHELGADKVSYAAIEREWVRAVRAPLEQWADDAGEPIRNAVLYFGAEAHTGLELVYVNNPALDVPPAALRRAIASGAYCDGAEVELEDDERPSFASLPEAVTAHADRLLARVCARLAKALRLGPARVLATFHDAESQVDVGLLEAAFASLDVSADAFVAGADASKPGKRAKPAKGARPAKKAKRAKAAKGARAAGSSAKPRSAGKRGAGGRRAKGKAPRATRRR